MAYHDRLRGAYGFPVDYELGRTLSTFDQNRRKLIFSMCKNFVVKIVGFKFDPAQPHPQDPFATGPPVTFLNGFFYCDHRPLIITSAHAMKDGVTHFYALLSDGEKFDAPYPLAKVKSGTPHVSEAGEVCWLPDVMVLEAPTQPPHPPRPYGAIGSTGDNAYVIGFAGQMAPQLSFNSGIVSCHTFQSFTIDTYAEPGYSGSPIFNIDGLLIGMVQSGHDPNGSKQVTAVPAIVISQFMAMTVPSLPPIPS